MIVTVFSSRYHMFIPITIIFRNIATVKRFYQRTNILSSGDKFEITLDQKRLKTPKGKIFEVDSKPLALAITTEWDSQTEAINRSNMHLTTLCNTGLDNPHNHSKLDVVNHIVNCLETDTILFHSSEMDELYKLQSQKWDPIIQWFCDRYQVDITKTQSIKAPIIPLQTKITLMKYLLSYNYNAVQGFMYGVDILKSVIITMAASESVISTEEAVQHSRLEEEYQVWWLSHSVTKILFLFFNSVL